jgi:adenine-specific DNA-methyltransferase
MRYLGNKTRMINNIEEFIDSLGIKGKIFCDLFSGSASVSDHFKDKYNIIANDLLTSSYIFTYAKVKNNDVPKFEKFVKRYNKSPFEYFTEKQYEYSDNHFIWKNYSPKGNRQFFTEEVANKIDGIRLELDELRISNTISENEFNFLLASLLESIMGLSNTTGTYEAFLKDWDKRAFKKFELSPLEMKKCDKVLKSTIFNEDSNSLIRKIKGDILYLDTPYTITDYNSAYHLLETVVKYDIPLINGKTGRRTNKLEKSKYSIKNKVAETYEDLIAYANFEHIIISYSTQSLLPIEELLSILKKYTDEEVVIKYYPFREYKNIRSSQKGSNLREVLIYLKKDRKSIGKQFLKSPLNYSGSKNYIIDQIIDELPKKMNTFVDAMGGAFNVGINISNAVNVVYNEYNPFVYEIINMLLNSDTKELIENIKQIVEKFGLEKGNKEKYLIFRDYYNKNKTPLNLFVLQMYCFQNQLRFNQKHDFNTPVGNSGCNETTFNRINTFKTKSNVITMNKDFNDLNPEEFDKDTVFYFDPPYIITNATYNDGKRGFKGWDMEQEIKLLAFLDKINQNGQKFLLSNVIFHNGKTNELLLNWATNNNYTIVELKPHAGRYGSRKEVLVKNY